MNRWQWALRLLTRRMWFRAGLFCLFAVCLALAGTLFGHAITYDFAAKVGAKSVDNILNVLASSMLAVTTFSLTAMVSAYSGATSTITPRAVQLLVADTTAQNALATFLGSFLFAIVGIIALSTGLYGESGRVILYAGTILVIGVIVITFLRWIEHITHFGRVNDTIDRVEKAATQAAHMMVRPPQVGPRQHRDVPHDAAGVFHHEIGRITHVDIPALEHAANQIGGEIVLAALAGTFVDPSRLLAWSIMPIEDEQADMIRAAFTVQHERAFDHDPRFGLVVLSEIASRALSPAVNDPGTAIAVIEAGTRVLATMLGSEQDDEACELKGVWVPPFALSDLLDDLYRPIARDGAGLIEVAIRLQKSLGALQTIAPYARRDFENEARDALQRACDAMTSSDDRERVTLIHRRYWP